MMKKLLSVLSVLLIAVSLFTLTAHAETAAPTAEITTQAPSEPNAEPTDIELPSDLELPSDIELPSDLEQILGTSDPDDEAARFDTSRLKWSVPMALKGFGITIIAMCIVIIVVILTNKAVNSFANRKNGDDQDHSNN